MNKILCVLAWAVFALLAVSQARADAPVPYYTISSGSFSGWFSTQAAACNAFAAFRSGTSDGQGFIFTGVGEVNSNVCRLYKKDGTGYQSWSNWSFTVNNRCAPSGSAPDTTKPTAEQCASACPADGTDGPRIEFTDGWRTGPDAKAAYAVGPVAVPSTGCHQGCTLKVYGKAPWFKSSPGANGYYESGYDLGTLHTGQSCTGAGVEASEPSQPTTPPPEPNRCPRGTSQIGTDSSGIPICRGDTKTPPENKNTNQTTTNNADGSKTTKKTETTTNSDGSTTTKTTTTTTAADGTETTSEQTTTGKTPDGKDGKSDSTDKDRNDLCKMNPSLNICRNSEISGSCEAVSCSGDAIQCAIARDIQAAKCKAEKDEQAIKDSAAFKAGNDAANGQGPNVPDPTKPESVAVGSIQAAGFLGGGSCFPDKTISVLGRPITLPFSAPCQYLVVFRGVIMLIALLISFRMLSGTFLRD